MTQERKLRTVVDAYGRAIFATCHGGAIEATLATARGYAGAKPAKPFRSAAGAPGGLSIDAAAEALGEMFLSLNEGRSIDAAATARAGDQVIDAIADIGLALWMDTVRLYHEGTFQHCLIVTGLATLFGVSTGMRRSDVGVLTMAALLHDIGKARMPLAILDKTGPLSDGEFAVIRAHPVIGHDYLREQGCFPPAVLAAVRSHHEYLDGSGYPDGLSGDAIGDVTRIITICDIYGALLEKRPYKDPQTPEEAIDILLAMARKGKVEESLVRALARG